MKVYCKARNSSKTHTLITKYFLGTLNILLVFNEVEKKRIVRQYFLSQTDADRIIPWDVANKTLLGFKGLDTRKLLIDNVDLFLERYFSKPVSVVTCTEES